MNRSLATVLAITLLALFTMGPAARADSGTVYKVVSITKPSTDNYTVTYVDHDGENQEKTFTSSDTDEDGFDSLETAYDHLDNDGSASFFWKKKDDKLNVHFILGNTREQYEEGDPIVVR